MNDVYPVAIRRDPSIVRIVEARENHPDFHKRDYIMRLLHRIHCNPQGMLMSINFGFKNNIGPPKTTCSVGGTVLSAVKGGSVRQKKEKEPTWKRNVRRITTISTVGVRPRSRDDI